jgi:hypothetical protein
MAGFMQKFGLDQLDFEQRLALIEEIWRSIRAESSNPLLPSRAQMEEFEARMLEESLNAENEYDLFDDEDLFDVSRPH